MKNALQRVYCDVLMLDVSHIYRVEVTGYPTCTIQLTRPLTRPAQLIAHTLHKPSFHISELHRPVSIWGPWAERL